MSTPEANAAKTFSALGDPTRLMLVMRLSDGQSRSIIQLSAGFNLSRQAITKHLRVLEQAGIVQADRVGRESRFSFVPEPIEDAQSCLAAVSQQWDEALLRLKTFLKRE
jgi:DNA-binding transcriptional ArsR family regulator